MNTVKELKKTIKQCRSFMKAARELNEIKKGSLALEVADVANELKKKAMELHDKLWEEYGEDMPGDIFENVFCESESLMFEVDKLYKFIWYGEE